MRDTSLLQLALGIRPPWSVTDSTFDATAHRLDIHIDFVAGSRLACPNCGAADCPAHDTEQMTWRHLNFFQHKAYRKRCSGALLQWPSCECLICLTHRASSYPYV
jgi:transposase